MMWLVLICASFFELAFTVCMKLSNGLKNVKFTVPDGHKLLREHRLAVCCDKNSSTRGILRCVDQDWERCSMFCLA